MGEESVKTEWTFENQFLQRGAISSPLLRDKLLLRNYTLASKAENFTEFRTPISEAVMGHPSWRELYEEPTQYVFADLLKYETVRIFTFGSLIHPISASQNINQKATPAIAFGLKRVFNFAHPKPGNSILGLPPVDRPKETARLNVHFTGDSHDLLNGICHEVNRTELASLNLREKGYSLQKILITDFQETLDGKRPTFEEAYVLIALPQTEQVKNDLTPHQNYLNVCLEGAKHFGEAFLQFFVKTTYLSDETTPLLKWLRDETSKHLAVS